MKCMLFFIFVLNVKVLLNMKVERKLRFRSGENENGYIYI